MKRFISVLLMSFITLGLVNVSFAKTKITFWAPATGEVFKVYQEAVNLFNAKSKNVEVEIVSVPDMERKLLVAVAGGAPPDVAVHWLPMGMREWVDRGSIMSLTPFIEADKVDLSSYVPECLKQVTFYKQIWGLPLTSSLKPVFYWNKKLFSEVGLNPNLGPKTWKDLVTYSDKLTLKQGDKIIRIGFTPLFAHISEGAVGLLWLVQKGVKVVSEDGNKVAGYINTPEAAEALQFVADLANRYGRESYQAFSSQFGSGINEPFLTERIAMVGASSPYAVRAVLYWKPDFPLGYSLFPTPTGKNLITFTQGSSMIIPNGSKHPKEAWEFIKWFSGPQQTLLSEKIGYNAGNLIALKKTGKVISSKIVITWYKNIVNIPQTPVQGMLFDEFAKARDEVIYGRKNAKQALDDLANKIQAEIDKFLASQKK